MITAFDTLLQAVVTAENAAVNSDDEAFRYECLCCGEEVFLAAQDSIYKATHFRHRSGNNDKECELYLGQYGVIQASNSRKSKQERVEFYYNNNTKCFAVSFNFSEEQISEYEKAGALLEIRDSRNAQPFFSTYINHSSFTDGIAERFVLERDARSYFISNTLNNTKREYYVFNYDAPSFFKVLCNDPEDEGFTAKYIRSKSIYIGVRYFIAWPGSNTAQIKLKSIPDVCVEKKMQFVTFGKTTVWGMIAYFKDKNPLLDSLLCDWGYNLDFSENVSLLWPPAYEKEERLAVSSSKLYFHSSFTFQGLGNINTTDKCISKISNSVTMVSMHDSLHILKKNAELEIRKEPLLSAIHKVEVKEEQTDIFRVPATNTFFLYSELGVSKLNEGQIVFLTPGTHIAEYSGNTLLRIIRFSTKMDEDIEECFFEILSNYWVTKEFQDISTDQLPKDIKGYLETCKASKRINVAVEQLIKGERK